MAFGGSRFKTAKNAVLTPLSDEAQILLVTRDVVDGVEHITAELVAEDGNTGGETIESTVLAVLVALDDVAGTPMSDTHISVKTAIETTD